jgi:hypothetical protein
VKRLLAELVGSLAIGAVFWFVGWLIQEPDPWTPIEEEIAHD